MSQSSPLISIIIPAYNRATLIGETLKSIIAQTCQSWECLVVDDGSTDATVSVIEAYVVKDYRIKLLHRPSSRIKGANACRNYGLENAKGTYVNFFDSDDLMTSEKLEKDLMLLQNNTSDFTISQTHFFYSKTGQFYKFWNDQLFSETPIHDFITRKIGWSTNAPLWRKTSLDKVHLTFDETLKNGQDYLFHSLALLKKLKPIVTSEILTHQREHQDKIEHTVVKTPSKAAINIKLLNFKKNYSLETYTFLKYQSVKILSNLYKHKMWLSALKYSLSIVKNDQSFFLINKVFYLFLVGTFYKVTGVGYSFLKQ